ncbi:MAG: FkbM family methyltransferase [Rubricella sp.]
MSFWSVARDRFLTRFGPQTCLVEPDLRVVVSGDMPRRVREALRDGRYEAPERSIARALLQSDDRVLDIGAGFGTVALIAARICAPGNVLAFEPNPASVAIFMRNSDLNGLRPRIVTSAITGSGGPTPFLISDDPLSSRIDPAGAAAPVPSQRFGDVIERFRPSVVIMDVEGAETELLRTPLPQTVRALMVEIHPETSDPTPMIEALEDDGFSLDRALSLGQVLVLRRSAALSPRAAKG